MRAITMQSQPNNNSQNEPINPQEESDDTNHNVNDNNDLVYNLFGTDSEPEISATDNDEFEYTMPKVFEDDDKFESDVNASISSVVENICQTKDLKIPGNCRSLVPPQVNPEIWQFLERKAKSDDLHSQTIQKLIGAGLIPIIQVAEILRTKTPSIKEMRDLISKAIVIMSNAHFKLSIKRHLHLKTTH